MIMSNDDDGNYNELGDNDIVSENVKTCERFLNIGAFLTFACEYGSSVVTSHLTGSR